MREISARNCAPALGRRSANGLIKYNITINIHTTSGYIKTFVTLVKTYVINKGTLLREKLELTSIIRMQVRPNRTPKNT
jgi:hypothetical protein